MSFQPAKAAIRHAGENRHPGLFKLKNSLDSGLRREE
jgi:hypothetical protein